MSKVNTRFDFLLEGIRNLRSTGSVAPSSRFLCKKIADKIDPLHTNTVVELGPGDGVITRYILERIPAHARLIIFEINPVFVDKIKSEFSDPRLVIIHDSAEKMGQYFDEMGIQSVEYIVSGIPFVMLPETLTESITKTCKHWLNTGGLFIQFHYSPVLLPFYKRIFGNYQVDLVPLNFPPALVVTCKK